MPITIRLRNNFNHQEYNTLEEVKYLYNYNDILYLDCSYSNISFLLPELPARLEKLHCQGNDLKSLPDLPNGLKELRCNDNQLIVIPELPDSLTYFSCNNNDIVLMPELPSGIVEFYCKNNALQNIPKSILSAVFINYANNPIHTFITKYFNGNIKRYFEYINKSKKKFVIKIENWFLDVKFNPKYKYCRKNVMKTYSDIYGENKN